MTAVSTKEAVERHLALWLSQVRESARGYPAELEQACAAVAALEQVGGLSAEEASDWRRRFTRTALGPPLADAALRARALAHASSVLSRQGANAARVAVDAFCFLGLLSDQDRLAVLAPAAFREDLGEVADRLAGVGMFSDEPPVRVVPGPSERIGGLRVTVIELFEAGVTVHWQFSSKLAWGHTGEDLREDVEEEPLFRRPSPKDEVWRMSTPLMELQDESATDYEGFRCEEVRSDPDVIGRSGFAPGPPDGIDRLAVVIAHKALWLEL